MLDRIWSDPTKIPDVSSTAMNAYVPESLAAVNSVPLEIRTDEAVALTAVTLTNAVAPAADRGVYPSILASDTTELLFCAVSINPSLCTILA